LGTRPCRYTRRGIIYMGDKLGIKKL
jgi:hypothetical protein